MNRTCIDSALEQLFYTVTHPSLTPQMKDQIEVLNLELYLLKIYTQCFARRNCALLGKKNMHLGSAKKCHVKSILGKATKVIFSTAVIALDSGKFEDWDNLVSQLLELIQLCKPKIKKDCLLWLDCSLQCKFSSNEFRQFKMTFSGFIDKLFCMKTAVSVDVKMQIGEIKEKLTLFSKIFTYHLWQMCSSNKTLNDFEIRIQAWAYNAACLSILYWVLEEKEDNLVTGKNFLFDKLQIIKPLATKVIGMYLADLKCLRPSAHHLRSRRGEVVGCFVDFFTEIWQLVLQKDEIQNLQNSLINLILFLVDPPLAEEYAEDVKLIDHGVESLVFSLNAIELKGDIAELRSIFLGDFLEKLKIIETQVRKLNARIILDSSSFNFPITNGLGFIESLLENLKEISIHFASHQILIVYEELFSLKPCLKDIWELQNQHEELKDLWIQIVNVAHRVEIVVNLFLYMNNSVWCDLKWLSGITDEIKLIKGEVTKIVDQTMYNIKVPIAEVGSNLVLPSQANMSIKDEIIVGLEDESEKIFDRLIGGPEQLHIISIVGMPGLGKTTLAKKVYANPLIQQHFQKCAWCCVSQTYQSKKLLLDIVSDVTKKNYDSSKLTCEELEEQLYKSLKGQRYLIVMDDIWDIKAWDALKQSLPNDYNGSRIMCTSRILDVSLQAKVDCSIHPLHPLSYKESWELLRKKLFYGEECPLIFREIGQKIAEKSKGLPLALVVIAGLLSKKVDHFDWWEQIVENLDLRITSEGCMDILELSYKHLPEYLKPCFLYFGVFQEDTVIRVKKLIQLWISEGFVWNSEVENLEDVAKEYLMDLVQRSLVTVAEKSSNGGIKACHVHDLLHEFCLAKGKEEKFSHVASWNNHFPSSVGAMYKHHRMCIQSRGNEFFASYPSGPCVHSLLFTPHNDMTFFSCGNFKILQVLDLEDAKFIRSFPEEITGLVLLRYLGLWRGCRATIPPSIANLKSLETFRVKCYSSDNEHDDKICYVPCTIWNMKRLRHVDIGRFTASVLVDGESEESFQLDNVQTFSSPCLPLENAEKILRMLPIVRKLRCEFHNSRDPDKKCNHFPVLDFLSRLESLNVLHKGNVLHLRESNFPLTLKKLTLTNFRLPWTEISTIGKLPNLEVLKLLADAFDGKKWDIEDDEFLNLKFLKLCSLNVEQWNASDYPFPTLQCLIVEECKNLKEIPSSFGEILSLKKVQVRNCSSAVKSSAKHIEQQQLDVGNDDLEVDVGNDDLKVDVGNDDLKDDIGNDDLEVDVGNDNLEADMGNDDLEADTGNDEVERLNFLQRFCFCCCPLR